MSGRRVDRYRPDQSVPGQRLFVGVPLPHEAASEIESIVERVRAMPLAEGARDVRWVRLDGLHLTLRFLGPTLPDRVDATVDAVAQAARSAPGPFEIEQFFATYKALEDKAVDVIGWKDREKALQVLRDDRRTWQREVEAKADVP